jgi:hypothetical protein
MATAKKATGTSKVYWKPKEKTDIAAVGFDILETDRSLTLGMALVQAQRRTLPENRWKSEHSVRYEHMNFMREEIEAETKKRKDAEKAKKDERVAAVATAAQEREQKALKNLVEKAEVKQAEIKKVPPPVIEPDLPSAVTASPLDMTIEELIDTLTDQMSGKMVFDFKAKLAEKVSNGFSRAYREVLVDELARGVSPLYKITTPAPAAMPPAPSPVQSFNVGNGLVNGHVNGSEVEGIPVFSRVKVALVGNASADDDYFFKIRTGLEDTYEFIRVKKPGDMHGLKDVKVIVSSSSDDNPSMMAAINLAQGASIVRGKTSAIVKGWLETQYKTFQAGMVQKAIH